MASTWISYNDLAWTEGLLATQSDYEKESLVYFDLIKRTATEPPGTLLHLGSGAGGHDTFFKLHFFYRDWFGSQPGNAEHSA